ncbi:MAG: hypothetical protein AAGG75_26880 [Bacteroidota bacterium]
MNNKDFDKFIREQLGKLEADFDGQHWEMMEHRLNTEPAPEGEMRPQQSLDDIVKNKLQGINVAFDENHWAMMDQKLEAELMSPEIEDIHLDGIAYDKLFDLNAPYNPSHWPLMSKRLDEAFSLRHEIVKYKIAEVAIMLLAILTLLPYLPLSKPNQVPQTPVIVEQQRLIPTMPDVSTDAQEKVATSPTAAQSDVLASQALSFSPANASEPLGQSGANANAESKSTDYARVSASSAASNGAEGRVVEKNLPPLPPAKAGGTTTVSPLPSTETKMIVPGTTTDRTVTDALEALPTQNAMVAAVATQYLAETATIDSRFRLLKSEERTMPVGMMHLFPEKRKRVRLGMFGAFDANYVMATSSAGISIPSYDQFFAGYGGGLSLGVGGEKWEVDFATIYASTYYVPRKVNVDLSRGSFAGGWYGRGLAAARIEMLKVPINVHRSLGKIGKTHISALLGASANVALFANSETRVVQLGTDPNNPQPITLEESSDNDIPSFEGVLEGGRLKDNLYLTANLGLRLERDLTARWSVFMQPSYQHRILSSGFGPTNDRINALSVYLGARVNLK